MITSPCTNLRRICTRVNAWSIAYDNKILNYHEIFRSFTFPLFCLGLLVLSDSHWGQHSIHSCYCIFSLLTGSGLIHEEKRHNVNEIYFFLSSIFHASPLVVFYPSPDIWYDWSRHWCLEFIFLLNISVSFHDVKGRTI